MDKYWSKLSKLTKHHARDVPIRKPRPVDKSSWFDPDQAVLPVYINNRNRLTSTMLLVEWLKQIPYAKPIILDNDSTYPPLLEWYKTAPCQILMMEENLGQCSLWVHNRFTKDKLQLQYQAIGDWFVHTDSDVLPHENCPLDVLRVFRDISLEFPKAYKVGFGLVYDDVPDCYAQKKRVVDWESHFWHDRASPKAFWAGIDTTFALYNRTRGERTCLDLPPPHRGHQITPALRCDFPYVARHLPWYVDSKHLDEEEKYYTEHTNRAISTWHRQS